MKSPIFIIGSPRSGTTLLASLLKYTSYAEPIESQFIVKYYKKLENYGNIEDKDNFKRLLNDILSERAVRQWELNIDVDNFYYNLDEISYKQIVNKICMLRADKKGLSTWGDKTPHYILELDVITQLFPESKYFYIVRDGRDVTLSLFGREWGPNNILTCADHWKKHNAPNSVIDELRNKKQLYFIQYEDLLDNAKQIVPDIYKFLDEEYDAGKMNDLLRMIRKGNYNKWKNKMNARQIEVFESVAANTLKRFGYETSYEESEVGVFTKALYEVHELFMRAKFLFKVNVIDGIKIKFFGKQPFAD